MTLGVLSECNKYHSENIVFFEIFMSINVRGVFDMLTQRFQFQYITA